MRNGKGSIQRKSMISDKKMAEHWQQTFWAKCKFCNNKIQKSKSHLHQGQWVGECCWDERLKVAE